MTGLFISEYMKNFKRNIVSVVLLTAAASMILLTIGNLRESYKYYKDIKPYLSDKGICTFDVLNKGTGDIRQKLDSTQGVHSYKLFSNSYLQFSDGKNKFAKVVYLLDEKEEETMMPELDQGEWVNGDIEDLNTIHVLVTGNDEGFNAGEEIAAQYFSSDGTEKNIKIKIDGVIKDGERIPGYISYSSMSNISYENLYGVFDREQNEESVFVSTEKEFNKLGDVLEMPPMLGIIRYDDNLTENDMGELTEDITGFLLSDEGSQTLGNVQLEIFRDNSKVKIDKIIMKFIPFAIVAFVLSIICSMASSAVDTLEGIYRYTVYYLTGMKWGTCVKLSGFSALCNIMLSIVFSSVLINILKLKEVSMAYKCRFGMYEMLSIGVLCLIFFCTSVIMPMVILRKQRPAELLKINR